MFLRRSTPLEKALQHRFRRLELLEQALTHRSFANEQDLPFNNERLEFLGDAVLDLVTVEVLFARHPAVSEGKLSKLKARLVSERALSRLAQELELGTHLRLGVGEDRSGGREKASILADAMEAVIGALYLDGGLDAARRFLFTHIESGNAAGAVLDDAKTRLQEALQARGGEVPVYRLAAESGPDHRKRFHVDCLIDGRLAGSGEGRSKKVAERRAAAEALKALS